MRLGSFTLNGTTINVNTDYDQITGLIYRFVRADNEHQVAFTTYKGMELAAGVTFDKADLQRGLDSVRRPLRRLPPGPPCVGRGGPLRPGVFLPTGSPPGSGVFQAAPRPPCRLARAARRPTYSRPTGGRPGPAWPCHPRSTARPYVNTSMSDNDLDGHPPQSSPAAAPALRWPGSLRFLTRPTSSTRSCVDEELVLD
jgi:hypothetical protein